MAKIQLGKFKANGQEYQKLQINRTLGPSIGDQAYLGRFSSHDGNHSLALSIHDVIADTIAQYKIFSSLNVANGVWSEVEPTSKLDKQDIVVSTRTDGPVISIRVTRVTKALGSKEYQVKCLNLRPVMETYLREVEVGLDGEYGQGYITPRPMPQVQLNQQPQVPPIPPMTPVPGKPMPANGIDTAVLFKMLMDHMAAPAPHVSHEIIARRNRPFGYAGLDGRGMLPAGSIPAKAKLTIRIGNDVVVYDGTTDVDLSFTNSGLIEDLGVSVAASLNSSSAATDDDIAGLFDDDPMTPPLASDDPGLMIDDDTIIDSGSQSQGGSQSTGNQSTSSHQCANGCYCSGGTNEECHCGDGCCTTSTSENEQTPAEQQPAEQQPAEQTSGNHGCQCSCGSTSQQQSHQPQYSGYPYGYPQQYMVPPMYGTHFPPPPPPPFPPFPPNQSQQNSSGCSCNCSCNNGGNTNPNPNPAPEPELYSLTLSKNISDFGAVEGSGSYAAGTNVVISAIPDDNHAFVKWSDESTAALRTIVMPAENTEYTAYFGYALTVSTADEVTGTAVGSGNFLPGEVATISVDPVSGYHFLRWSDGNSDNPRSLVVDGNINITAYFEEDVISSDDHTLYLHTNNSSLGTVTGAGEYPEGAEVSIIAEPIGNNIFIRWNDGDTNSSRIITMPGKDTWYAAYFGNITSGEIIEVEGEHPENTTLIQAIPAEGYHFVRWNDNNQDNPRIVSVDEADSYTAVFEQNTEDFELTVGVNSEERGSVNDVGGVHEPFTHIQLFATPKTGYTFMGWSDGITDNPRTIVMEDSYNLTALFDTQYYTLTLLKEVDAQGNFELSEQGPYTYGQTVVVTPVGTEGYHFLRWDDYLDDNPRTVIMTEDKTMTAFFTRNSYNLTLQANDDSMCESLTGAGTYVGDQSFQISALAKDGFMFVKWDDENDQATRTLSLTRDLTLTAIFDILKYHIEVTVPHVNESMVNLEGEGYYTPGSEAIIRVDVLPGNAIIFDRWNNGNTNNPRTIIVNEDAVYTAVFVTRYDVTLSVNDPTMGNLQVLVNDEVVHTGTGVVGFKEGTRSVIKAIPASGYTFTNWSGLMSDSTNPRPVNINGNYNIQANFAQLYYTLTVRPYDNHGSAEIVEGNNPFTPGATAKIQATPIEEYYRFANWNDGNKENPRTVIVNGDDTYVAYFELDTFRIKVTSNNTAWGTVSLYSQSPSGSIIDTEEDGTYIVNRNATLTFEAKKATDGYHLSHWSDNESITSARRSFEATGDKTIQAVFVRDSYNVTLGVETNSVGKGTVHIEKGESTEPVSGPFVGDTLIRFVAEPEEGYQLDHWSDNNNNHENPRDYLVTKNATINAYFSAGQYTVTLYSNDTNKGTVSIKQGTGTVSNPRITAMGTVLSLIAIPASGYEFTEWSDHNTSANRSYVVPAHDSEFTAYFEPKQYTLTLNTNNPEYGRVEGSGTYAYNSSVTIKAIANEGYEFSKWSDNNPEATRSYPMPNKDTTLTATFVAKQYDLTVNKNDTGRSDWIGATISYPSQSMSNIAGAGAKKAAMGATIKLTPAPAKGGVFIGWDDNTTGVKEFSMPAHDVIMAAYFGQSVSCELSGMYDGCKVTGTGNYKQGDTVTLRAVPASGYDFFGWDDGDTSRTKTFTVGNTNITRTAIFYNISTPPSRLIIRDIENPSAKAVTVTDSTTSTTTT